MISKILTGASIVAAAAGWGLAWVASSQLASVQGKFATYKATAEAQAIAAALDGLRITKELDNARDTHQTAVEALQASHDAAVRRAAATRLRDAAAAYATSADCPGEAPAPASVGDPAAGPAVVLADVLGQCDAMAERYAATADAARIAGQACQVEYEALVLGISRASGTSN